MSAIGGIFHFAPQFKIRQRDVEHIGHHLRASGPDEIHQWSGESIAMTFCAFHTTAEDHSARQPLSFGPYVLCWDGRIDNRDELLCALGTDLHPESVADNALVTACYEHWGDTTFSRIRGDWALALWDTRTHELTLSRDYIGVRRLFYFRDSSRIIWASTVEALLPVIDSPLELDITYFGGRFTGIAPLHTTPYENVRAVLPATVERFNRVGQVVRKRYWSLSASLRNSDSMNDVEEEFREVFGLAVRRRLRSDAAVAAELSGGLDSSSIVCVADQVSQRFGNKPVLTISHYDEAEPSGDERPYFTKIEAYRGVQGSHVDLGTIHAEVSGREFHLPPTDRVPAAPGQFLRAFLLDSRMSSLYSELGARAVLSGFGGDELLGGIQFEAPEIADAVCQGRWRQAYRASLDWAITRNTTIFAQWSNVLALVNACHNPERLASSTSYEWLAIPAVPPLSVHDFTDWKGLSPSQVCLEWTRFLISSQLTNTPPMLAGCIELRYPMLDQSLFEFLARTPRREIVNAQQRRSLMRRALRGIVPDDILSRRSKWFGERATLRILSSENVTQLLREDWLSDGVLFELPALRQAVSAARAGHVHAGMHLCFAVGVEQWLRQAVSAGMVHPPRLCAPRREHRKKGGKSRCVI